MRGVGESFPQFKVPATVSTEDGDGAFREVTNGSYEGRWLVVFFYPKDFTFVCPTEIKGFADLDGAFRERDAQVLAASVDSEYVHRAWRLSHPDLKSLPFPMLADVRRELSLDLGILDSASGVARRATYIVDPGGVIRHVSVNDMNVGRNPAEILRILDALQTDELCGCNWKRGDEAIVAK